MVLWTKLAEAVIWNLPSTPPIKNSGRRGGGFGRAEEQAQSKKKGNNSRRRRGTCRVQAWEPIRSGCFLAAVVLLVSAPIRLIMATLKRTATVRSSDILERGPTGPIKSVYECVCWVGDRGGRWGGEEKHSFPVLFPPPSFSSSQDVMTLLSCSPNCSRSTRARVRNIAVLNFHDNHRASSPLLVLRWVQTNKPINHARPCAAWCVWR